ncbi:MAG: DUF429 domain-containing protein [Gammaproteobacteria bacterium]
MRIFGVDFTSSPGSKKPITCVVSTLENQVLSVDCLAEVESFEVFENFLESSGPWIAGLDFPFGQPRRLIAALGWPESWEAYVRQLEALTMHDFEALLQHYRQDRSPRDRQHLRAVDARADARSPMMLYGVPVGRMFLRGAPRLARSSASVLPCRPSPEDRVVVEAYPALVARRWIGRRSYKSDTPSRQTQAREQARRDILNALMSARLAGIYGFQVALCGAMAQALVEDGAGDQLDALMCAVQAAWAYTQRGCGYGIPVWADALEGWIVDPAVATPPAGTSGAKCASVVE